MGEPQNRASNETDLSESWTIVDTDDSDVNTEVAETSDSESLEVLEVEQAEPAQDSAEEEHKLGEEEKNCYEKECTPEDCNDSCIFEDPVINIAAVQKVRKYVHHPSAYINMWLSIVLLVTIAITVGLGVGHFLGSKRFARIQNKIHHLKYENQVLEQKLADMSMKHKYCERDMQNRDTIFDNWSRNDDDNDVCYAEDNLPNRQLFKDNVVNTTVPMFLQWFTYDVDGERHIFYPIENVVFKNGSQRDSKHIKGDASFDVNTSFSKLEEASDKILSTKTHLYKLSTQLINLRSLVKKWGDFRGNLQLHTASSKAEHCIGVQNTKELNKATRKIVPRISGNSNKVPSKNIKRSTAISCNDCYRSKIKQCFIREEKPEYKKRQCKALSKVELLCSLLLGSKSKWADSFLESKQRTREPEAPRYASDKNRNKKSDGWSASHSYVDRKQKNKLAPDEKKYNCRKGEENCTQKHFKSKKGSSSEKLYSTFDSRRTEKKNRRYKEQNDSKHKYFAKSKKIPEKKKMPSEKQSNKLNWNKKQYKKNIETNKQNKRFDSKKFLKYIDKKSKFLWNRKDHNDRFRADSKNRNQAKHSKKNPIDYKYGLSTLIDSNSRKFTGDYHNCDHSKFNCSGNSYILKTKNYSTKTNSSNYHLKYNSNKKENGKYKQKHWNDRSKMYKLNVQEIKVINS